LDNGDTSYEEMAKKRGDLKVTSSPWTDSNETYEGMKVLQKKEVSFVV